eukprot:1619451-Pyramimonas_sp.AAC.1
MITQCHMCSLLLAHVQDAINGYGCMMAAGTSFEIYWLYIVVPAVDWVTLDAKSKVFPVYVEWGSCFLRPSHSFLHFARPRQPSECPVTQEAFANPPTP